MAYQLVIRQYGNQTLIISTNSLKHTDLVPLVLSTCQYYWGSFEVALPANITSYRNHDKELQSDWPGTAGIPKPVIICCITRLNHKDFVEFMCEWYQVIIISPCNESCILLLLHSFELLVFSRTYISWLLLLPNHWNPEEITQKYITTGWHPNNLTAGTSSTIQ